jgi:hypothetical protein
MMISDDYDFPPAPKREAFAMCLVAALVLAIVGWGLWSLAFMGLGPVAAGHDIADD